MSKIKIAVSSCLLGEKTRYDGKDKHDPSLISSLSSHFECVSVCPEVEVGMPIPREKVQLIKKGNELRLVGVESNEDWTDRMENYAKIKIEELYSMKIAGYVFKSKSPSCGVYDSVPLLDKSGNEINKTDGLFASLLIKESGFPIEDEMRLQDPALLQDFIARVQFYAEKCLG